jgi:lysozyme family protein
MKEMTDKELNVFNAAFSITINHETLGRTRDYVNDPQDPGGETKFGISKRAYPNLDIRNLTIGHASEIYLSDYWRQPNLHTLSAIAPDLAIKCFVLGVVTGTRTAIRLLQHGINTVCTGEIKAQRLNGWRQSIARLTGGQTLLTDRIRRVFEIQ